MTDKKDWPQWLRDAETVDAVVDVVDGCVKVKIKITVEAA